MIEAEEQRAEEEENSTPMQIPLMAPFVQALVDSKSAAAADSTVTLEAATSLAFSFVCMKGKRLLSDLNVSSSILQEKLVWPPIVSTRQNRGTVV